MNETEFAKQIRQMFPGFAFKVHGGPMQTRGLPDLLGCWNGKFVGIEFKIYPNKLTKMQEHVLTQIAKTGGLAFVFTMHNSNTVQVHQIHKIDGRIVRNAEVNSKAQMVALFERSE